MSTFGIRRTAAALTCLAALTALGTAPAAAARASDTAASEGTSAQATWSRINLSRIHVIDLEEDGWLGNGDEIRVEVFSSQKGFAHIWPANAATFKVSKDMTCIAFGRVCDTSGTNYTTAPDGGGVAVQDYTVGDQLSVRIVEDDTVGPDILAEARITVDGQHQTFHAHSPADAGFAYMIYGTLTPIG
jgi:hypothetical protein